MHARTTTPPPPRPPPGNTIAVLAAVIAVAQLVIYNNDSLGGEKMAHYFEFCFNVISATITFFFTMDNKSVADREVNLIMYGNHLDCGEWGISAAGPAANPPIAQDG